MRFSNIFTTALAVSMPVASIAGVAEPADEYSHLLTRSELDSLTPRQDLTSALGDLVDLLKSVTGLLTPEFFDDVQIVVHGLADLLADPFANQTRSIVSTAVGLLDDVGPLLNTLKGIDIAGIIDSVTNTLGKIDLEGIINSVAKLLTPGNIDTIGGLLSRANKLLSDKFIQQIQGLIDDVAPLVSAVSQFVTALINALLGG